MTGPINFNPFQGVGGAQSLEQIFFHKNKNLKMRCNKELLTKTYKIGK